MISNSVCDVSFCRHAQFVNHLSTVLSNAHYKIGLILKFPIIECFKKRQRNPTPFSEATEMAGMFFDAASFTGKGPERVFDPKQLNHQKFKLHGVETLCEKSSQKRASSSGANSQNC